MVIRCDRSNDGQPQACANSAGLSTGRSVEPLEDGLSVSRSHDQPLASYRENNNMFLDLKPHFDPRRWERILECVVDKLRKGCQNQLPVGKHRRLLSWRTHPKSISVRLLLQFLDSRVYRSGQKQGLWLRREFCRIYGWGSHKAGRKIIQFSGLLIDQAYELRLEFGQQTSKPAAGRPELAVRITVNGVLNLCARASSTAVRNCSACRAASAWFFLSRVRTRSRAIAPSDANAVAVSSVI
jgi:hypothetical protein